MKKTTQQSHLNEPYWLAFQSGFTSAMQWTHFDELWQTLNAIADDKWYIYAIGEMPPENPASKEEMTHFLDEMAILLKKEHDVDYCGIVYADDKKHPRFIKIFDPNNLGVSCGFSDNPPLPGWILSKLKPIDLPASMPQTASRKHWWQKIFSS